MRKLLTFLLVVVPVGLIAQNYALQISGNAKISMTGNACISIAQSSVLGIYRNTTTGGIICDNEQSRINWLIGAGTGNYLFPLMSPDGDNVTAEVNIGAAGTGAGSLLVSSYHTPANNMPFPSNSDAWFPDVTNVWDVNGIDNSANVPDRFWLINYNGYTSNPTATITLKYDAIGGTTDLSGIPEASLMAEYWDGVTWSPYTPLLGTVDPANDMVTGINNINFNAPWVLVNMNFPLPVELLSLTAECGIVEWTTASESNCDFYQVLFSKDARDWEVIAIVDGGGNVQHLSTYTQSTEMRDGYFKLVQTDYDGDNHTYGPVINTCSNLDDPSLRVFPNPFETEVCIVCPENCKLEIFSDRGKLIHEQQLDIYNVINLENLSAGLYSFRITGPAFNKVRKLIKNQ